MNKDKTKAEYIRRIKKSLAFIVENLDKKIDLEKIIRLIKHPNGLFKNSPEKSCKILILNQADTI